MSSNTYETLAQKEQSILTRLEDLALRQRRTGRVMTVAEAQGLVIMAQASVAAPAPVRPDSILELD